MSAHNENDFNKWILLVLWDDEPWESERTGENITYVENLTNVAIYASLYTFQEFHHYQLTSHLNRPILHLLITILIQPILIIYYFFFFFQVKKLISCFNFCFLFYYFIYFFLFFIHFLFQRQLGFLVLIMTIE
jgi:hypothetical protein